MARSDRPAPLRSSSKRASRSTGARLLLLRRRLENAAFEGAPRPRSIAHEDMRLVLLAETSLRSDIAGAGVAAAGAMVEIEAHSGFVEISEGCAAEFRSTRPSKAGRTIWLCVGEFCANSAAAPRRADGMAARGSDCPRNSSLRPRVRGLGADPVVAAGVSRRGRSVADPPKVPQFCPPALLLSSAWPVCGAPMPPTAAPGPSTRPASSIGARSGTPRCAPPGEPAPVCGRCGAAELPPRAKPRAKLALRPSARPSVPRRSRGRGSGPAKAAVAVDAAVDAGPASRSDRAEGP